MTTWGGFGMLVCIFIMIPVVLLHRSKLSGRMVWIFGIPSIALGHYLGWLAGMLGFGFEKASSMTLHLTLGIASVIIAPIVTAFIALAKRRQRNEVDTKREEIRKAIAKITEDGVVHGPKGPYRPHESWNVGQPAETPRETKGPEGHGPYGMPMP